LKKITIRDVAQRANVSTATVSRVLNHSDQVDANTAQRVRSVMEKYEYSPSLVARSLSQQGSNVIGVIIPEIDNPFYGKILRTLINLATAEGMSVLCFDTDNDPNRGLESLRLMRDHRVRGLIYAPSVEYGTPETIVDAKRAIDLLKIPVVLIDRDIPALKRGGVYLDNFDAGFKCTKVLLAAGHRRIGILTGPKSIGISRERLRGYTSALEAEGVQVDDSIILEGDFTAETAYGLGMQLLEQQDRPTAVITCNNMTTLGFLQAINESGLDVPGNLDLVGIDSIDAFDSVRMPYNHVTRNRAEMAQRAMDLLLAGIHEGSDAHRATESVMFAPGFIFDKRLSHAAQEASVFG
jgi:LacI family transcriptional regulator